MKYKKIELENVAQNIRVKRVISRITQKELASISGVSEPTIINIENCKNEPKLLVLSNIAKALDCRLEDLLY